MLYGPFGGPTTTYASTVSSATSAVSGYGVPSGPIYLANTYQKGIVHFTDGSVKSFDTSLQGGPLRVQFDLRGTSAPAWIDLTVPNILQLQLTSGDMSGCDSFSHCQYGGSWYQQANVVTSISISLDNGANSYQVSGANNAATFGVSFTPSDALNTEKDFTARIIASGSYGVPAGWGSADISGWLAGKTSVTIVFNVQEAWDFDVVYTSLPWVVPGTNLNIGCGGVVIAQLPFACKIGPTHWFYPPGAVSVTWGPNASGPLSVTANPIYIVTCPGDPAGVCLTQSSFATTITSVVWGGYTPTIIQQWSATTSTLLSNTSGWNGNPNSPATTTTSNGNGNSGSCQLGGGTTLWGLVKLPAWTFPDWMCGKTLGINNLVLLIIGIFAFAVLLYLALRPRK